MQSGAQPRRQVPGYFISRHARQRLEAHDVAGEHQARELGDEGAGPVARVRAADVVGDAVDHLVLEGVREQPGDLRVLHRGRDQDPQRPALPGVVPGAEQRPEHAFRQGRRVAGQGGAQQLGRVGGQRQHRAEEPPLRPEEVAHQGRVHAGLGGDRAHRDRLVALGQEPAPGDVQHLGAGLRPPGPATAPTRRDNFIHHG